MIRWIKRTSLALIFLLALYVGSILLYGTLTDWQPTGTEPALVVAPTVTGEDGTVDSTFQLITWNVGYGGIGDKDFFFYNQANGFWWTEMGTVRPSKERVEANVVGQEALARFGPGDILLFQEVDTAARRSHYVNQWATVREAREGYYAAFAPNFISRRVPIPFLQPWDHYGDVVGGLVTLSKYAPVASERIQLPGEYGWPTRLFQLDRCALRQVFPVRGGGELAIYNVHLSAYDADGSIRRQQMNALRETALADFEAGRSVIIGGDWNQLPPNFTLFGLNPTLEKMEQPQQVSPDFMPPGWNYAYDPTMATVRASDTPYNNHTTRKSLIDFYLLSPDLRITSVRGIDQEFEFSDHQPVLLAVEIE